MDIEEQSEEQSKELSIVESFRNAGIAKRFIRREETLSKYGSRGKVLAERVNSGELKTSLQSGNGCFFVGDDEDSSALFHLTCRACLLHGVAVKIFNLPFFRKVVCTRDFPEEAALIQSLPVIAIQGFYDECLTKPFTADEIYSMDWFLREHLNAGCSLILQSTSPICKCAWWPTGLRDMIAEKTVNY